MRRVVQRSKVSAEGLGPTRSKNPVTGEGPLSPIIDLPDGFYLGKKGAMAVRGPSRPRRGRPSSVGSREIQLDSVTTSTGPTARIFLDDPLPGPSFEGERLIVGGLPRGHRANRLVVTFFTRNGSMSNMEGVPGMDMFRDGHARHDHGLSRSNGARQALLLLFVMWGR